MYLLAKICSLCDKQIVWPDIFNCFYCQKQYCPEHSQPENHECPKVSAAKHIKGDYLRERGVNITSGRYRVECKIHGFITDYFEIGTANQKRIERVAEVVEDLCQQNLAKFLDECYTVCKYNQQHLAEMRVKVRQEFPERFFQFIKKYTNE